jgi:hypothetical protein
VAEKVELTLEPVYLARRSTRVKESEYLPIEEKVPTSSQIMSIAATHAHEKHTRPEINWRAEARSTTR